MSVKISVIIPVYKVEHYIHQCVDSVLTQTLHDIEIILVDDGSPDRCGDICDEYAEKNTRIKVIHKENGGLMSAWKAGVDIAKGQYLGFVDSDDWVDRDMYEKLYLKGSQYHADIVSCGLIQQSPFHSQRSAVDMPGGLYCESDIVDKIYPSLINNGTYLGRGISPNRVTKIYTANIVRDNLQYCTEDVVFGEDMLLTFSTILDAKIMYICTNFHPYHYRTNAASITKSYNAESWQDILKLNTHLLNIANEKDVYNFEQQIASDLISLSIIALGNEFHRNNNKTNADKVMAIKNICTNEQLVKNLKIIDVSKFKSSKRIQISLITHQCYWAIFLVRSFINFYHLMKINRQQSYRQ